METNKPLTFGPVNSRRFGISLGIDLSPTHKQCNFDCLYCELEKQKTISTQTKSISVSSYIKAVQKALIKDPEIEVLTITANGEPTMYPYLDELVDALNNIKEDKKLLILSNSSLISNQKISHALHKIDIVKLSLDCASQECFKKLDRIDESINPDEMITGIIKFAEDYKNELILEILFVENLNDHEKEINNIYAILKKIQPTRVDIGTIDRPPAYDVKAISYEKLLQISNTFDGLNVSIVHKNKKYLGKSFTEEEMLNLLAKRPQTKEDIENLFDSNSQFLFQTLIEKKKIIIKNQAGVNFYGNATRKS